MDALKAQLTQAQADLTAANTQLTQAQAAAAAAATQAAQATADVSALNAAAAKLAEAQAKFAAAQAAANSALGGSASASAGASLAAASAASNVSKGVAQLSEDIKSGAGNKGVETRIDTTNEKLTKANEYLDRQKTISDNQDDANVRAAVAGALDSSSAARAGVSRENGFSNGITQNPSAVSNAQAAYTPMADLSLNFGPLGTKSILIDPVAILQKYNLMPFLAAARGLVTLAVLVAAYRWFVSRMGPLVAGLFTSDSVNTSTTQSAGASFVVSGSATFSLIRPVMSASRLAVLVAVPLAVVGILDNWLAAAGGSSSSGLIGALNPAYNTFISMGGRGLYILNLGLPISTIVFTGLYTVLATSLAYAAFAYAKAQSAAIQSV